MRLFSGWRKSNGKSSADSAGNLCNDRPAQKSHAQAKPFDGNAVDERPEKDPFGDAYGSPEREELTTGSSKGERKDARSGATAVSECDTASDGGGNRAAGALNGSGGANDRGETESLPHRKSEPPRSSAPSSAPVRWGRKPKEVERARSEGAGKSRVVTADSLPGSATTGSGRGEQRNENEAITCLWQSE